MTPIPVNLVTGPLGAGKTSAILRLLRQRPPGETWAVLVNDFGAVGIDGAALSGERIAVREVAGGCACCAARLPLRITLVRLLREVQPRRVLIEPSGLAHASDILALLQTEGLAGAVDPRATLCLVDPRRFDAAALAGEGAPADQVAAADVLVAAKAELADRADLDRFREIAAGLYPPPALVAESRDGAVDPAWLDLPADPARRAGLGRVHEHEAGPAEETRLSGNVRRIATRGSGGASCGWIFPATVRFRRAAVEDLLKGLPERRLARAKGVFRTEEGPLLANWMDGVWDLRHSNWRRDSRFEILIPPGAVADWSAVEGALLGAMGG